jgi:tetratricopeptide (TPR) repeat protein/predicted ATPase
LVTSREVLHLPEERVIQVDGLDVPAETGQVGLDDNQDPMEFASIRLFLHFAGKLNPEFVPSQADLISISHICRLVGGLPLGIRLAASWMGISPPHQISQQLESNLDILALQRPVQTEQERQFEAVFEYFWNLLSDAERQVLCRLSVFQGPFNRGAASHIAGASPFFLSALVDRSFLQADVEGRFELHETLRQFSGQNLVRYADEPETVRQTHANYFLGLLNQAVSGMRSRHQKRVLADLTSVFENIRTAWYWSLDSGHIVQLGLSAEGLSLFLDLTSRLREGVNFFGDTVTRLEIDSSSTPVETQAFGVLLGRFGKFLSAVGQKPRALKITEQALAIAESSQNDSEIAFGLNLKGWLLTDLGGAHIEAIGLWQKGLAIYRRLALPWGISTMLQNLAYHLPPSKAGALLAERHEIAVEMDDLLGLADSQLLLGSFNLQTGTLSAAKTHVELGIQHFEELRNREGISYALVVLAKIALRAGDLDSARRNIQTSISLDSMIGNLPGLAMSAHTQFLIEFYAGNYRQAYRGFKERLAIAQTEEDSVYIGGSLWGIGISAMALGEMEEATEQLEAALTLFESTQNSWWQARVLSRLVQLHCLQGDHEIAWQRGQTAIGIAEAGGDHLHLAKIHHNLARAALDLSELDKAAESLATALEHSVSLQAWPAGLSILVETAQLFSQLNRNDQALELLNRIADHRLTFKTDRSRAAALLETLGQAKPTADQADPEQSNTVDKWVAVFWDRL